MCRHLVDGAAYTYIRIFLITLRQRAAGWDSAGRKLFKSAQHRARPDYSCGVHPILVCVVFVCMCVVFNCDSWCHTMHCDYIPGGWVYTHYIYTRILASVCDTAPRARRVKRWGEPLIEAYNPKHRPTTGWCLGVMSYPLWFCAEEDVLRKIENFPSYVPFIINDLKFVWSIDSNIQYGLKQRSLKHDAQPKSCL